MLIMSLITAVGCGNAGSPPTGESIQPTEYYQNEDNTPQSVTFTDALGREVEVSDPKRTAVLLGSFAEIWLLAGGGLYGATQDAIDGQDRLFEVPDSTINLGAFKAPSMEIIIAEEIDFVILSSKIAEHVQLLETFDNAGITAAYFEVEDFDDYLEMLKVLTDITGEHDLYEQNGRSVQAQINSLVERAGALEAPTVLHLRTFSTGIRAKGDDTTAGAMIAHLGGINVADLTPTLLDDLSMEEIIRLDPDFILVTTMGADDEAAIATFEKTLVSNPAWSGLTAVQNGRSIVLSKSLFHFKPNAQWGEAYQQLFDIIYGS